MRMLGPENHFRPSPSMKRTVPGVFPIRIQFIKLWKFVSFCLTGYWTWSSHIVNCPCLNLTMYNKSSLKILYFLFSFGSIQCLSPLALSSYSARQLKWWSTFELLAWLLSHSGCSSAYDNQLGSYMHQTVPK